MICLCFDSHLLDRVSQIVLFDSSKYFKCIIFPFPQAGFPCGSPHVKYEKPLNVWPEDFLLGFLCFQCTACSAVSSVESRGEIFAHWWTWSLQLGPDPKPRLMGVSSSVSAPVTVGVNLYGWLVSKHITMFKKGITWRLSGFLESLAWFAIKPFC